MIANIVDCDGQWTPREEVEIISQLRKYGGFAIAYTSVKSFPFATTFHGYKLKWIGDIRKRKMASIGLSLKNLLLGPWTVQGLYYTFHSAIWNFRGGFDLTDYFYVQLENPDAIASQEIEVSLFKFRRKLQKKVDRLILLCFAVILVGFLILYNNG